MTQTTVPHPRDRKGSHDALRASEGAIRSLSDRRAAFKPARRGRLYPNRRIQIAGKLLHEHAAMAVTEALEAIDERLGAIGYPKGGDSSIRSDANGSPSEAAALKATQQLAYREDLRDAIDDVETRVHALINLAVHVLNRPRPGTDGHKLCAEGQMGREGADEWGDAKCTELPVRGGLCEREAKAESRWRRANGLTGREEPAA